MAGRRVPAPLRTRLGDDATIGLVELLDAEQRDWSDQVLSVAADRFERRLTEECSALRLEFREALHDGLTAIRQEIGQEIGSVRQEIGSVRYDLRQEMHDGLVAVRQEIANGRVEWLRWSFVFWIGQVAAIAALLSFMLKR